jgi:hypothetical protein
MIKRIWLHPPLAFARVGSSQTPCDNFFWGPDDLSPEGTARTRIVPTESLHVDEHGVVTAYQPPSPFRFKDGDAFRPVCPFFELHAEWEIEGKVGTGPLTKDVLDELDVSLEALTWRVEVSNLKAFHMTKSEGDRVGATLEISARDNIRHELQGESPTGAGALVPTGRHISLGHVQVTQPTEKFPELRVRFTPPAGKVYAPRNFAERIRQLEMPAKPDDAAAEASPASAKVPDLMAMLIQRVLQYNAVWDGFVLPEEQCLLNPDAAWTKYRMISWDELLTQIPRLLPQGAELKALLDSPGNGSELIRLLRGPRVDVGSLPPSIFAFAVEQPRDFVSLGMIDDTSDGTISVELAAKDDQPAVKALARIVVTLPSFAPDRRLPVSIADGLIDRTDRQSVRNPGWVTGDNRDKADAEVADLLDRAYETAGLQNIDALADFARQQNEVVAIRQGTPLTEEKSDELLWHGKKLVTVEPLPLTALALQRHRRNSARLVFEMFALETKKWFERTMREPAGPDRYYNKRMPGLMCGFDRRPIHLTRRQYELLRAWSKRESEAQDKPQDPKP